MKTYEYSKLGLENLTLVERSVPRPAASEVVVRFHAASLNYRELLFAWGLYNPNPRLPAVPGSDGAGEVTAIGGGVTRWKVGDRVCPIFMQGWLEGPLTPAKQGTSLGGGGDFDGTLREYGAFHEDGLVRIPDHLSYAEAATLPCAAVTAWNALVNVGKIKAGDTILTLGTGGVSIFALQIAKLHGARVIATSSSDEKLARVRKLGADETINYKTIPEWDAEVLRLTGGAGVDHVVEVGGAGTLPRSANATRVGGTISVIGVLAQGEGLNPLKVLMKTLQVQGVFVGSRQMFEALTHAVTVARLKPVIDRTFAFGQLRAALDYMHSGAHCGKIVIRLVD
ncbi:MAG: NAD(P)-dependent alcohol dehydrogenase [Verrucomicrobia subdivision 3 bacterium]|nr:NAD(P)-dependent alcohol dehydrogenase [Limisphaerales bacterium]